MQIRKFLIALAAALTLGCGSASASNIGGGGGGSGCTMANPSGTIVLTAVNGSAATCMRSDATPALGQAIAPTWTGLHTFDAGLAFGNQGVAFGTTGAGLQGAWTQTDSTTAAGTVATAYAHVFGAPTFATASNAITITDAGSVAFKLPLAGSNVTLTTPSALELPLGTQTTNFKGLNLTATFNNAATTFDAPLFENVTNTASHSGSLIADLQIGGSSYFSIAAAGNVTVGSQTSGGVIVDAPMQLFFNGNENAAWNTNNITVQNGFVFQWTNASNPIGSVTAGLSCDGTCSAAILDVGNGTAGDKSGTLKLTTQALQGVTVASLPGTPAAGMVAYVTDANAACTFNTTPTGGGSTKCFVGYNGSAWKEFGI